MTLPSSGELSLGDIATELGDSAPNSLGEMSDTAGFTAPDAVSDFYGYTHGGGATLSASPGSVGFESVSTYVCGTSNDNQTITITASTGNSWTASVLTGTSWVQINEVTNGTANGTGNGSFTVDAARDLTETPRNGAIQIVSDAPTEYVAISQGQCP